ncbi:hypothetical protein [Dyadobacter sp. CY323]|uniref:hypothetical protein n=1 Tax=Dyadobacter sp. CY323 TaxID=2907302 RepID=UPI001F355779|nr:hypothetical protein [Dyadobacter sp. CY323]MCE6988017.1 hypothetical protein [Dyadobacter sp. CY323]
MAEDRNQNPATDESYIVSNVLRFRVPFIPLNRLNAVEGKVVSWTRKWDFEEKLLVFAVLFVAVLLIFRSF